MAELITLARPYAKAAFAQSRDSNSLADWSTSLAVLGALVKEEKVETLLTSPALTVRRKSEILIELCGKLGESLQKFIHILAENKRLPLLPQIYALFELYKADYEKTLDVEIVSAFKITQTVEKKLGKALTERLKRKVNINTRVEESLLGGVVIHAGDTVIDSSIRGRLAKLAAAMNA